MRVHMFDSILETMRALMDPMVLFEEAEDTLLSMQELSQIEWPDDKRPESGWTAPRPPLPPGRALAARPARRAPRQATGTRSSSRAR